MGAKVSGGGRQEGALPLPEPFPAKGLRPLETITWRRAQRSFFRVIGNRRARRPPNHQGARTASIPCDPPPCQAPKLRFPKALSLWWGGAKPIPSLTVARMCRASCTAGNWCRVARARSGVRSLPRTDACHGHGPKRDARCQAQTCRTRNDAARTQCAPGFQRTYQELTPTSSPSAYRTPPLAGRQFAAVQATLWPGGVGSGEGRRPSPIRLSREPPDECFLRRCLDRLGAISCAEPGHGIALDRLGHDREAGQRQA
jgi:hypothetical protein